MRSAALLEARRQGAQVYPVLRVNWRSRALDLGAAVYSTTMRDTAVGGVTAVTKPGGWGTIKYGSGISESGLMAVETSVSVADTDSSLIDMLETYDPRGSEAFIDWAAPGLVVEDWEPAFSGLVTDWARDGLYTKLILKTDDTNLRSPIPPGVFNRAEWGSASETTIYGTSMPLIMGVHDSWQVTARGMVAATNIRYDKDQGFWWLASTDRMIEITRIYFDGIPQDGGFEVLRGVYGPNFLTIISIYPGFQPEKGVVVAFDCRAMDEAGLIDGIPLTGAPDQLRAVLQEYTFRPAPLRGWRGDLDICEPTSWDAVSEFFALHKIESARRFGGDQEASTAAEIIDSFLKAFPWTRMWWTETGQIAIAVLDPDDPEPGADWMDLQKHHEGGQVPFFPGDRREVYSHIRMPFMFSSSEQKYLSAYEAHDVAALPEKLELVTENPWSQCRFGDPTGDLNPAPPADPALPPVQYVDFTLTLTGTSGYNDATVYLVPLGDWNLSDPLDRALGANTRVASGGQVVLTDTDPDWGGTFDLVVRGSDFQWGGYLGSVTIEPSAITIDLEWPRLDPIGESSVTKSIGQTCTPNEFFATDPPSGAAATANIYLDDFTTLLVSDTWNGSTWAGTNSAALSAYASFVDCWWFNPAWHNDTLVAFTVS